MIPCIRDSSHGVMTASGSLENTYYYPHVDQPAPTVSKQELFILLFCEVCSIKLSLLIPAEVNY